MLRDIFKMLVTLFLYNVVRKILGGLLRFAVLSYVGIKVALYFADNGSLPYPISQLVYRLAALLPSF